MNKTVMARSELVQRLDSAYKTWREEEKFSTPRKLIKYLRRRKVLKHGIIY